jgi:hypothetical protein
MTGSIAAMLGPMTPVHPVRGNQLRMVQTR